MTTPLKIEYYLNLPYQWLIHHTDEGYVVYILELQGCVTDADHWEAIPAQVREAMTAWIRANLERGRVIPEPKPENNLLPASWRNSA